MTKISRAIPVAAARTVPIDADAAETLMRATASLANAAGDALAATTRRDPVFQRLSSAVAEATTARSHFEDALAAASPPVQVPEVRSEDASLSIETPK